MKLIFSKAGKYKSERSTIVVEQADVKSEKVFEVYAANGVEIVNAKYAVQHKEPAPEPDDPNTELEKMTVKDLAKFAADNEIELGDAKKKADIIKVILEAAEKVEDDPDKDPED